MMLEFKFAVAVILIEFTWVIVHIQVPPTRVTRPLISLTPTVYGDTSGGDGRENRRVDQRQSSEKRLRVSREQEWHS